MGAKKCRPSRRFAKRFGGDGNAGAVPAASTTEIAMRRLLRKLYLMWAALVARLRRLEDGPEWAEWERASLEDLWMGGGR